MFIWLLLAGMVLLGFLTKFALNPLRTLANMIQVIAFFIFLFAVFLGETNDRWGTLGGETDPIDIAVWSGAIWVGVMVLRLLPHFFQGMEEQRAAWEGHDEQPTYEQHYSDAYRAGFADAQAHAERHQLGADAPPRPAPRPIPRHPHT